jgi:LysR family transcriptional regulator, carnitine catabolism transcriptional activator
MIEFTSRQLRAFLLVAQHHNFSRAAEALFITPSGLSLLIRELEKQLGFRLFDRTTRHVGLTTDGNQLLPVVRRNLEELENAVSQIGQGALEASQTISVGAGTLFAANILPRAIRDFRLQRPNVRIQLCDAELPTVMQRVEAGMLDMGLGWFKPSPEIRRTPFFRFSMLVIRPDSETEPHRGSTSWSALKGERLISIPADRMWQQLIDKHLAQAGVLCEPAMVVNLVDTQIAMVEAGEGVAIVPSFSLPACRNRRVIMSRLVNPKVTLDFYQIRNRGRKLPQVADEFTAFLHAHIARWARGAGVL